MVYKIHANDFRDLIVYQKSRVVAKEIFDITKGFPNCEAYSLTDQIRRSSRSVGAQIAEAWAKRRYEKSFVSKLTDADGEQRESQHWVEIAFDCGYITIDVVRKLNRDLAEVGRLLYGMIDKSDMFCNQKPDRVCEEETEYFSPIDHELGDDF